MDFSHRVYRICRKIPQGRVSTYKEIGRALGIKGYRAVGNALNRNPYAPDVPCHRVVKSDGSVGGFAGGEGEKTAMLKNEGVAVKSGKITSFRKVFFRLK